jgi:hypothetical protein
MSKYLRVFTRIFTNHPESIGETYTEHLLFASLNGLKLMFAGLACIIHSIFPFVFVYTASRTMQNVNEKMAARKKEKESLVK